MKLQWDKVGERLYETGLDRGVLFPMDDKGTYEKGVAWNGITAVNENPSGAESTPLYADNQKYLNLLSAEDFGATVEAYTYPPEFEACDGSAEIIPGISIGQQNRKSFGLAYRSLVGNDVSGQEYGYKIHLVYGGKAAPSGKQRQTVNESPEAVTFSWELTTTPVAVPGFKPTAHLIIDSTKVSKNTLTAIENILYGQDADAEHEIEASEPRLPLPEELITLFKTAAAG